MNNKNKEAIVILAGALKKENNKWRTTNYDEGDKFGATGDRLRVAAGNYLYYEKSDAIIIASGGKGQYKDMPDAPTMAGVIREELVELGVPKENIIQEEKSGNTWQGLREVKKIIQTEKFKKVIIISNEYHLPRIEAMIKKDKGLKEMIDSKLMKLQSAEEICLKHDREKWRKVINYAYNSEVMKKRIKLEAKGVQDLEAGNYKISI